jgi:broad specificity phosphatase PhoE
MPKTAKTVYFGRHGEGYHNLAEPPEIYLGAQTKLTELGRQQAIALAERARKLPIGALIASTMERAQQTARVIARRIDKPIISSDLFVEVLLPTDLDGKVWRDPETQRIHDEWGASVYTHKRVLDGEHYPLFLNRGYQAFEFLEDRPEDDIFVVGHGLFTRVLAGIVILGDMVNAAALQRMEYSLRTVNTGLTVFKYDPDREHAKWSLLTWNDHAHL